MNTEKIGAAAGALWARLSESGDDGISLTELKKQPGLTSDEVVAAVGWLAREGKVSFKAQGRRSFVALSECATAF